MTHEIPLTAGSEGWARLSGKGPSPIVRTGAVFAYDAADGYSILFGGCGAHLCPLGDTWKLQSGVWTNLTSSLAVAPPPRTAASMVYDSHDGYLILVGGTGTGGTLGDVWHFSAGTWTLSSTTSGTSPPARSSAAMTYDSTDALVLLFGGVGASGSVLGDTWTYAGGVWTNLASASYLAPSARSAAALAFDPSDGFVLLFGGQNPSGSPLGDTWSFAQGSWTNLSSFQVSGPSARFGSAASSDPGRGGAVLYGGANGSVLADSWLFSHHTWSNLGINLTASPLARSQGSATFDSGLDYVVMFGGAAGTSYRSGLWALVSPLTGAIVPTAPSVIPGTADQFRASVTGGLPPFNESWSFGDGSATVPGPTAGHTYQTAGTYAVTLTIIDSLGATIATSLNLSVTIPRLTLQLHYGPGVPIVGEVVTLTANASGGVPPYQFHWAGATNGCSASLPSVLTCPEPTAGTFGFSAVVTDSSGRIASMETNITVQGASGSLSKGPTGGAGAGASAMTSTLTALAAALAIALACGVGVVTYRAGKKREAARKLEQRPLCYAVPAWSETPAEFRPPTSAGGDTVTPWERP